LNARIEELQQAIRALGRPQPLAALNERVDAAPGARLAALVANTARAKEWDAAHPEQAAQYRALLAELEQATRAHERTEAERRRVERAVLHSKHKLERSGVGHRSLESAAAPEETEALGAVRRWLAQHDKTWLVLCGPKGTGKSVAATWAVREACRSGSDGAFRRASELAKLSGFNAGAEELEHLKRVALLVIDDAGTELLTDHAKAQFHELCDYRHEFYGRTILTSNLRWFPTADDKLGLRGRLGDRIADRVAHAGSLVQLGGTSMRDGKRGAV